MEPPVNFNDITGCEINQDILRSINRNDPTFTRLTVGDDLEEDYNCYERERGYEASDGGVDWLGYLISKNDQLSDLRFMVIQPASWSVSKKELEQLYEGIGHCKSIQSLDVFNCELDWNCFFKKVIAKNNLGCLKLEDCERLGRAGAKSLSLALIACIYKSLYSVSIDNCELRDSALARIIGALAVYPDLRSISFHRNAMSKRGCFAMAPLLRKSALNLTFLNLGDNSIDDEAVEMLTEGLILCEKLRWLTLSENNITNKGFRSLSTILKSPTSLDQLDISGNTIDDDTLQIFADALVHNSTLKKLLLTQSSFGVPLDSDDDDNDDLAISAKGWSALSRLLCDESDLNSTCLSNHTIKSLGGGRLPDDLRASLDMNNLRCSKRQVAMMKILRHYPVLDMKPFFEWEFKVLPTMTGWLDTAMACAESADNIDCRKLYCIFQFVRGMPDLYIDSILGLNQGKEKPRATKRQKVC